MLSEQGNRFYFIFSLTTHYQNDEFISVCCECEKALREVSDFSHKNYFNNWKGCLIRCYVKKIKKFTFRSKKTTIVTEKIYTEHTNTN